MMKHYRNSIDRLELAYKRNGRFESSLENGGDDEVLISPSDDVTEWWEDLDLFQFGIPPDDYEMPDLSNAPDYSEEDALADVEAWEQDKLMIPFTYGRNKNGDKTELRGFCIGDWWFLRNDTPFKNSPYKYNYRVMTMRGGVTVGYIYYQTYLLNRDHIYLRVSNKLLYSEDVWEIIQQFTDDFHLDMRYVSKLDIAVDSPVNVSETIYTKMKDDPRITWIINGRKITDRDATLQRIFWNASGSLNDPIRNKTLNVKQEQGVTQVSYNKTTEICDKSGKFYQIDEIPELWSKDEYIYRNEVRLDRMCIIKYKDSHRMDDAQLYRYIQDEDNRDKMFTQISQRMIRWWEDGRLTNIPDRIFGGPNGMHEQERPSEESTPISTSIVC